MTAYHPERYNTERRLRPAGGSFDKPMSHVDGNAEEWPPPDEGGQRGFQNPPWADLTRDHLKDPAFDGLVDQLVRAAVYDNPFNPLAYRVLFKILRASVRWQVGKVLDGASGWHDPDEMVEDVMTFLIVGLRPSLRQKEPKPRSRQSNAFTRAPLVRWLEEKRMLPLEAFVAMEARGRCQDRVRRAKVQRGLGETGSDDDLATVREDDASLSAGEGADTSPNDPRSPEGRYLESERRRQVAAALDVLNAQQRYVFDALLDGKRPADIARALRRTPQRIKAITDAAVAKLRKAIASNTPHAERKSNDPAR